VIAFKLRTAQELQRNVSKAFLIQVVAYNMRSFYPGVQVMADRTSLDPSLQVKPIDSKPLKSTTNVHDGAGRADAAVLEA
jgi:hypothetical protein